MFPAQRGNRAHGAGRSAGEQQEAGQRFASAWCFYLVHLVWCNQHGTVHSLPFMLLKWVGAGKAALETRVSSPTVRDTSKLNRIPLESQSSSRLVARAEEKQILQCHLALLVLIIT